MKLQELLKNIEPVQIIGVGAAAYDMNLPVLTARLFFQFF